MLSHTKGYIMARVRNQCCLEAVLLAHPGRDSFVHKQRVPKTRLQRTRRYSASRSGLTRSSAHLDKCFAPLCRIIYTVLFVQWRLLLKARVQQHATVTTVFWTTLTCHAETSNSHDDVSCHADVSNSHADAELSNNQADLCHEDTVLSR